LIEGQEAEMPIPAEAVAPPVRSTDAIDRPMVTRSWRRLYPNSATALSSGSRQ
jgi:hypothetical protein